MNFIRTSLLGLLALPMAAQSSGFGVGGALIVAPKQYFGAYEKVTHNTFGFIVNGSYDTTVYQTDVPARLTVGVGFMPGKEEYGLKTSLTQFQVAGDILLQTSVEGLHGVVGISVNYYSASFAGTESTGVTGDPRYNFPFKDCKGTKFGYRLGLEYAFNKSWSGELMMQQTELAGHSISDNAVRRGGINPAWLQLGVHYKF